MSENGTSSGGKEAVSKPAPAKESAAKESTAKATTSESKKVEIQNGKGDAPRNVSKSFRKNYDKINWSRHRRVEGSRIRKVY